MSKTRALAGFCLKIAIDYSFIKGYLFIAYLLKP